MENLQSKDGNFIFNLEKISESTDILACIRLLALKLQEKYYVTYKDAMEELSNLDFILLKECSKSSDIMLQMQFCIYAGLLYLGEGVESDFNVNVMGESINRLMNLFDVEMKIRYESMDFDRSKVNLSSKLSP